MKSVSFLLNNVITKSPFGFAIDILTQKMELLKITKVETAKLTVVFVKI